DLQLCLGFTECNQSCPCPIGRPYQRLWAPQTTRMQGTTWVQRQINSNSLIFEPPTCVATQPHKLVAQISGQNLSPASKSHSKVFGKVGSSVNASSLISTNP